MASGSSRNFSREIAYNFPEITQDDDTTVILSELASVRIQEIKRYPESEH